MSGRGGSGFGSGGGTGWSPRNVGGNLVKLTRAAFRARGFAGGEVLTNWRAVVGETLADQTVPERLTFPTGRSDGATLKLRVAPGFGPEVQHLAPLIVERINTFYGYRAVARLALAHGPLPRRAAPGRPPPRALTPAESAWLGDQVSGIENKKLQAALLALGRHVIAAQ
jgi:hypothetical protein